MPMILVHPIALALALATPSAKPEAPRELADLVETAASAGSFQTLLAAVQAAGLEDVLKSEGPFTVLAPTDAAFAQLPDSMLDALLQPQARDLLSTILRYHVVPGRVSASEALAAGSASTLAGEQIRVSMVDGQLRIGGANVTANDIETRNGIIHAIDTVLVPDSARNATIPAPPATPASLLELAIERGAPLYNRGQPAACAAVYEVTARALLALPEDELPEDVRTLLADTLRELPRQTDARNAAWALRRGLDRAYAALNASPLQPSDRSAAMIDDFDQRSDGSAWGAVNDTVMGGRSRSSITANGNGTAVFAGVVSLENNGGFASVRRIVDEGSLRGFAGVELRVRGDGNRYSFSIRDRSRVSGDSYRSAFETEAGEWTTVRLPFAEMERSIRGYRPPNSAPLPPDRIRGLGISIGDKQEGSFRLEIDSIRAYREQL